MMVLKNAVLRKVPIVFIHESPLFPRRIDGAMPRLRVSYETPVRCSLGTKPLRSVFSVIHLASMKCNR